MAEFVCIDSMICVWGVKKEASQGQEHMIKATEAFLNWLDQNNKKIILPAPVITEILAPVDNENKRTQILDIINRKFIVGSLDAIAAIKAGEIWNKRNDWKEIYKEGKDIHRKRFKFDTLIIGIAVTKKVSCLYSQDSRLRKIAEDYIRVEKMPEIPIQTEIEFSELKEKPSV